VDLCSIEHHRLLEVEGPVYIWTIPHNASRAITASAPSKTQELWQFLQVLFTGIYVYGAPIGLVSDGGSVFKATVARELYARLGIEKARIARRHAWQNDVESHVLTMKHMGRYRLEQATSWEEFCRVHARFVADVRREVP
jgi:hypothetical protein